MEHPVSSLEQTWLDLRWEAPGVRLSGAEASRKHDQAPQKVRRRPATPHVDAGLEPGPRASASCPWNRLHPLKEQNLERCHSEPLRRIPLVSRGPLITTAFHVSRAIAFTSACVTAPTDCHMNHPATLGTMQPRIREMARRDTAPK